MLKKAKNKKQIKTGKTANTLLPNPVLPQEYEN